MARSSELEGTGFCPFLFPVVADRLWMRPIGLYCRRPGQAVRVPAASTLARRCTTEYRQCDRFTDASRAVSPRSTASSGAADR